MRSLFTRALDRILPNVPYYGPLYEFNSFPSLRLNQRRQEHLVSLGLPIAGKSVLEVGAGIGAHTHFFRDRGCQMTVTEGRPENLRFLRGRYPGLDIRQLDLDNPAQSFKKQFDLVYCYGVLYHLQRPAEAIAFMAANCSGQLLLETCVSFGTEEAVNLCPEPKGHPSQAVSGQGCRPTRPWVYSQLAKNFPFVYMPVTQPYHEQFPLNWNVHQSDAPYTRAVFIASKSEIQNPMLVREIPAAQRRE
jgi:SAM-dependent methyltransferase